MYFEVVNEAGLRSSGGTQPTFGKSGKKWKSFSNLQAHLKAIEQCKQHCKWSRQEWKGASYEDARVVVTANEFLPPFSFPVSEVKYWMNDMFRHIDQYGYDIVKAAVDSVPALEVNWKWAVTKNIIANGDIKIES